MQRIWAVLSFRVCAVAAAICAIVFAGSAVFTNHFLNKSYQRYSVTLVDASLSSCDGGLKGNTGTCKVTETLRFADGSTGSYTMSDGGSFDPTLVGDFNTFDTPTLADFDLSIGQSEHIWLAHRDDTIAYDYAPNTTATVWVRGVVFFGFFFFGIRAWILHTRRRRTA